MPEGEQSRGQGRGRAPQYGHSLLVGVCLFISACAATEESIQKSQGHYQEGIATLSGDRQKAFVSFQKAVQLNPKNKEARYGLGHVYALQGKLALAEEEFRTAIQIDDAYSEAHTYLGQVLASQGKWDEAIQSYRAALANPLYATPDLARFHLGQALTHLELGRVYAKLGYAVKAREILSKVKVMDKGGEYAAAATELLARLK